MLQIPVSCKVIPSIYCHASNNHAGQLQPPESVATHVIRNEADNVLVMLDWAPVDGVSYNVTTCPSVPVVFNENTIIQLMLHYNTQYNVSILVSLCGQSLTVNRDLNFGESIILYQFSMMS